MKPVIELYLITSTTCNVRCKSCPAGRKDPAIGGIMSLEMLERILSKCTLEARVLLAQLYFYNETFMIPHMPGMINLCHKYKVPALVSSNLTLFKHGPAIMAACPERLLISVSGWTQPVYERSHAGGDIEVVKANMAKVAELCSPKTEVQVSWHHYRYNEHEMQLMREYAHKLGFGFVAYGTSLLPPKRALRVWETGIEDPASEDILVPVMEAKKLCYDRRHWDCNGQDTIVVIDSQGDMLNCNGDDYHAANRRGNLFDTTIPAFLKARKTDKDCIACKAVGGHIYCMQKYTLAEWSPMRMAGVAYRRLGLSGYFEPIVRKFYGRKLLPLAKK